jgi:hypothetical protein
MPNFHVFVLMATIINFAMIRKVNTQETTSHTIQQVIRSTLLLPIVSYSIYFWLLQRDSIVDTASSVSSSVMSAPYPATVSVSM